MKINSIDRSNEGFTLLELLSIVAIIGVLSGITFPNWFGAIAKARLNNANFQVYAAMRQAQRNAMKDRIIWQASFREENGTVEWAIYPATVDPARANWNELNRDIKLDSETTLENLNGIRTVKFDRSGNVAQPPLGRITLSLKNHDRLKRCVFVATIIGTLRMSKERSHPREGAYCY